MARSSPHVLFSLLCLVLLACQGDAPAHSVLVHQGVAYWPAQSQDAPLSLDGEWKFYPDTLALPGSLPQASSWKQVPGIWEGEGFATYSVRLINAPKPLFLYLRHARCAYALYANHRLVAANGHVGTTTRGSYDQYRPVLVDLYNQTDTLDLVVQVSNHSHRSGGLVYAPLVGSFESLYSWRLRSMALDAFMAGALVLFAFYHLALFALHREKASLYFGLFCACMALRTLTMGQMLLMEYWTGLGTGWLLKLEYASMFGIVLFLAYQQRLFSQIVAERPVRLYVRANLALLLLVMVLPSVLFTRLVYVWIASLFIGLLVFLPISLRACWRGMPYGRVFLPGFLCVFGGVLNDILNVLGYWRTCEMTPPAMTALLLFQSMLLSSQYKGALDNAARLRRESELRVQREIELRRMQWCLSRLLDSLDLAVAAASPEGVFLYANAAFAKAYGLEPGWEKKRGLSRDLSLPEPGKSLEGKRGERVSCLEADLGDERLRFYQVCFGPVPESAGHALQMLESRLEGEDALQDADKRSLGVALLQASLDYWKDLTGKDKFALAESSRLWRVEVNEDGWERTRTLDRYLDLQSLPRHPRWQGVVDTAEYVLCYSEKELPGRAALESMLGRFRSL